MDTCQEQVARALGPGTWHSRIGGAVGKQGGPAKWLLLFPVSSHCVPLEFPMCAHDSSLGVQSIHIGFPSSRHWLLTP